MIEPASRADRLRSRAARTGWERRDTVFLGVAAIVTTVVHPVQHMLTHPYWLDEAWVAVLTKAPFGRLVGLSSSTPAGFVVLLRLVPGSGLQRARLVVLAFSALTVGMAYVLTRSLTWRTRGGARGAAIVAALVVMLVPLSLFRNDLKQYTCDGFCALLLLAVGARADRSPKRSRLGWVAVMAVIVAPFSSTSAFVSVAVFAGLLVSALVDRAWRRAFEVAVVGGVAAIGLVAYFGAVVVPNLGTRLHSYWAGWYLRGSPWHVVILTAKRLSRLSVDLAMPALVFVAFFALGIAVLVKMRAHALVAAILILWLEMAVVGRLERYPFLDLRTSHFLLVSSFVIVAIGAVGLVDAIARLRLVMNPFLSTSAAVVVGGALAGLFGVGVVPSLNHLHIPVEDVRSETLVVAASHRANDVIVVNASGNFGFSYYWPHGRVRFIGTASAQGFRTEVRGLHAIYAQDHTYGGVLAALRSGVERRNRAGAGSRLFIVRIHLSPGESAAWRRAFDELHLKPRRAAVGSDPLLVVVGS